MVNKKGIIEEIYVLHRKSKDKRYTREHRKNLFDRADSLRKKHKLAWVDVGVHIERTLSKTVWKKYK